MITFPKIKAASWAIGKRLQGYHLLQNPAGTTQTEISMLKEWHGMSPIRDDVFQIERIKKVYNKNKTDYESKFLVSMHFFDNKKMCMTKPRKKDISFCTRRNGEFINISERHDMAWEQTIKRTTPKIPFRDGKAIECNIKRQNFFKVLFNNLWSN